MKSRKKFGLVPDRKSLWGFLRIKVPGLRSSKRGVVLNVIQPPLSMTQPRELSCSKNLKGFCGRALALLAISLSCFANLSANHAVVDYPGFYDNPHLTEKMQVTIAPYLLPVNHPIMETVDAIFSQGRVTQNQQTLVDAGFEIIAGPMPRSFIIVARHPAVPGYVFKIYLDSEERCRDGLPHWKSLAYRCAGAYGIRKIIEREKIRHFSVPDKWLYLLPPLPFEEGKDPETVILIATDMELESYEVTKDMWRTIVTKEHLDELHAILKHGFGGRGTLVLSVNVPFTKRGKFAFTDTESHKAELKLKGIKKYLSKEMQQYWFSLIQESK